MRITWLKPEERIEFEFRQLAEEGVDASAVRREWELIREAVPSLTRLRAEAERLLDECARLSASLASGDTASEEPSELPEILQAAGSPRTRDARGWSDHLLDDRIGGGWIGRMAGCLLGKPAEGVPREGIREILQSSGCWPLTDYFSAQGVDAEVLARFPFNRTAALHSLRENIVCMPEDDDINFTMVNLSIVEAAGEDWTTEDVATAWLRTFPGLRVYTAERVAYQNLLGLLEPPATATFRNPYREWIGAQIRADLWGWVSPGDPQRAAELAWRDARLSHVKNGIYGEMFAAAMVAGTFLTNDGLELLEIGLSVVPAASRLAGAVRYARDLAGGSANYEQALDALYDRYGHYHWVHTINNAAVVALALLYGRGDFGKAICYAVMGGWDTDCNGATVGSIMGTMLGRAGIPERWSAPLRNRVRSSLAGFDNSSIEDLIRRTVRCVPSRYRAPQTAEEPRGG